MNKEMLLLATSFSKAGFTVFKAEGKQPKKGLLWRQQPYTLPSEMEDYLGDWDGNYALAPTPNQLIVDIDPRNFEDGDKPHLRLFQEAGISIKTFTTIVQTGGGGLHVYFNLPDLPEGKKIRKNPPAYKGIDFISDGAYVIGAGSIHPETDKPYKLMDIKEPAKMATAPDTLLNLILVDAAEALEKGIETTTDDDPAINLKFKEYLHVVPAAVEGANGDALTYQVACKGRDLGLSAQKVFDLMAEYYNPRCAPQWPLEELLIKVKNAYIYATGAFGADTAAAEFSAVPVVAKHPDWRGWDRVEGKSKLRSTCNNIMNFFINYHEAPDNPLLDSLMYNALTLEVTKVKWMPWDKPDGRKIPEGGVEWTDSDTLNLRAYLSVVKKLDIARGKIDEAIVPVAQKKSIHPIKDWLRGLKWDGVERLETWLTKNSGAVDNKVNRALSKVVLMQAVARIYKPGCKCDLVVVLEGDQGIYKSTLVEILGGEFYADITVDPNNKDTADAMRGKWILEMSEMVATRKAEIESLKRFLTIGTDRYRAPFARRPRDIPRQSVFIGTINPDASGQYLSDTTGNRRFGPINLKDRKIDTEAIRKIRDQLFAEAVDRIMRGEPWHIIDKEVEKELKKEQEKRTTVDSWMDSISKYVHSVKPYALTTTVIWHEVLGGSKSQIKQVEQKRIANCLREMGYERKIRRINGSQQNCYVNPDYKAASKIEELFE